MEDEGLKASSASCIAEKKQFQVPYETEKASQMMRCYCCCLVGVAPCPETPPLPVPLSPRHDWSHWGYISSSSASPSDTQVHNYTQVELSFVGMAQNNMKKERTRHTQLT